MGKIPARGVPSKIWYCRKINLAQSHEFRGFLLILKVENKLPITDKLPTILR